MAYDKPIPATLKIRYPAFAAVGDDVVQYWLTDAERFADTSWMESDYAPALIAYAAHRMAETNVAGIKGSEAAQAVAAGLVRWKSASADMQFSDTAVAEQARGGLSTTLYGREYLDLLAKNKSGGGTTAPGSVPCGYGFNGYAGPLPPRNWPC